NSVFTNIVIENTSRRSHRKIDERINVEHAALKKLPVIIEDIKKYLTDHKKIDNNQPIIVGADAINNSGINFIIQAFTKTTNQVEFAQLKQEIILEICDIFHKRGAKFPISIETMLQK